MKWTSEGYRSFFNSVYNASPRKYQMRVAEGMLAGRNTVLVAPTGAGKTIAVLAPFLYAKSQGQPIADRVIYALPLRSLASALHLSTRSVVQEKTGLNVTIQMGNQPSDPYFEGDVVFTTIDQLLSAYVGAPYGASTASANLPPGALLGALVIIDEFHLLAFDVALPTFLDMMQRLHPYTQFVVMTATAPTSVVERIADHLGTETVELLEQELLELPRRERMLTWHSTQLDVAQILQKRGKKTLVVVNTVQRANELFMELATHIRSQDQQWQVRCLHSRMFESHRSQTESWVLEGFGRDAVGESIVIATQVVEVGLDISADVLMTELCPANALIQRAGRCVRFAETNGHVHIFSTREEGKLRHHPYELDVMERTEEYLSTLLQTVLTAAEEQALVETVHGENDNLALTRVFEFLSNRREAIDQALIHGNPDVSALVRDVDYSVSVLVHDDPTSLRLECKPERVSLRYNLLKYFLTSHFERQDSQSPVGWYPNFIEGESKQTTTEWVPITSAGELYGQTLICLSPLYVHYHADIGLVLKPSTDGVHVLSRETLEQKKTRQAFDYFRETYLEHVQGIRAIYQEQERRGDCQVANQKLNAMLGSTETSVAFLAELVGTLHDVGKLTDGYQTAVRRWQLDRNGEEETELLAHTDYRSARKEDRERAKQAACRRPHHSVEGAQMAIPLLKEVAKRLDSKIAQKVYLAALLSIMRHHNAWSTSCTTYKLAAGSQEVVAESLKGLYPLAVSLNEKHQPLGTIVKWVVDNDLLALYWYFVRRLRLNDRLSQERLARGKQEVNSHEF